MSYLVAQILVCLLVAFGLGLGLGWLLGSGRASTGAAPEDEGAFGAARQRIRTLEADLADCRAAPRPPGTATPLAFAPGLATPDLDVRDLDVPDLAVPGPPRERPAPGVPRADPSPAALPRLALPPVPTPRAAAPPVPDASPTSALRAGGVLGFGPPAPAARDDLTRIEGVGPVLQKQLAGLGLVTYRQIAALSEADARRVGEALGVLSDRIARQDWVAQAARLAAEPPRAD